MGKVWKQAATTRLEKSMLAQIDELAAKERRNRSQMLRLLIERGLAAALKEE